MTREEFIKQRCEIDKITEEEFEKRYRVVKCNCGQPYCKGYRCLDLDGLLKENQSLKKKLEETNGMIEKCGFVNIEQVMLSYCGLIAQQKEFIKWLEDEKDILAKGCSDICKDKFEEVDDILQQYKKIIGE